MSFISPEFLVLFAIVVPLYYLLSPRYRWMLLLSASYIFYMSWRASYIALILLTTVCDFFLAQQIERADKHRSLYLSLSLALNISILVLFKYFNFFNQSAADLMRMLHLNYSPALIAVILPLGISFYTFQEMAYVIDVYRGTVAAERQLGIFALFVAFFPQLVAGPIERATNMLPQFHQDIAFSYDGVVAGFRQILWGAFKKIAVADRLANYVNEVFSNPHAYNGPTLALAVFYFSFQIYCDFSGYSDIAIGTARVLGFTLSPNFRQPYFALSVRDFWQRWHISLSSWFRDYVYFPLAVRTKPLVKIQTFSVILFVFLLSGLWHGANWTFVAWGGLLGVFVVCEYMLKRWTSWALPIGDWNPLTWSPDYPFRALRVGITFTLVSVSWIFFRANSLTDALYIVGHLVDFPSGKWLLTKPFGFDLNEFIYAMTGIASVLTFDAFDAKCGWNHLLARSPVAFRWLIYYGLTAAILVFGAWGVQEFIYFRF